MGYNKRVEVIRETWRVNRVMDYASLLPFERHEAGRFIKEGKDEAAYFLFVFQQTGAAV